jgi:uncharacterized damage-inducible protein DinB
VRADLLTQFERMEALRKLIDAKIDGVDGATLNRTPGTACWSVVQVMSHLVKSESLSVAYIRRKAGESGTLKTAGLGEAVRSALINFAMTVPVRFSAPAVVAEVPENDDPAAVRQRWEQVRAELRQVIESMPDSLFDKTVYRHPRAGLMNLRQALSFMEAHATRHARQIDETLNAVR